MSLTDTSKATGSLRVTSLPTPVGQLWLLADGDALAGCWFGELAGLVERFRLDAQPEAADDLGELSAAVASYFSGDVTAIDDLPVQQPGSEFRQACWKAMRAVPAGETISYRELAIAAGRPDAVRAAGSACATNAVAVVVPCHRILSSSGGMGGYAYGLDAKRWLLAHERGQAPLI
jgi:methylated-DNA-[protein]-cysteine S-methyltransferase